MVVGIKPVFGLVSGLPGFSAAHNERLLIYFLLCIALLAGWGVDDLSVARLPRPSLRRAVLISAGVIVCIPIVWLLAAGTLSVSELGGGLRVAWGFEHPPLPASGLAIPASTGAIIRDSALLIWLPLAVAGFALIAARLWGTRRLGVTPFVALTVLVLAVDLFRANMGFNPAIKQSTAVPPTTGAIRYLQSQRPNRFIGVSTIQLSQPLPDDLAMRFGLYDARGYDFPVEKRFDDLWRASVAPGVGDFTQPEEFASATPAALRALSLLSVSDLLVGPLQAIATPLHGPGLHVAYKGKDGVVYANSNALPRVFVVDRQRTVIGDKAELAAVTSPSFDARGVALTDHLVPGIQQTTGTATPPSGATAKLASYGAQKVVIDATATKPSLVVLTDSFYPGWKATVDGKTVPIERVDYVLRGVSVGPGHHTIVMRYQPSSWRIGWIVSLVALLGLLAALASVWIGKRRRRAAATECAGR
jgi:hypothetical protein